MTNCLIALGSNLGDRLGQLRAAVAGLAGDDAVSDLQVSGLYETAPVGGPDQQPAFLNAALQLATTISPADLLAMLHRIEAEHARERAVRWGPRTLDLDLLTYGDLISEDAAVHVPHPRMHLRRFVMVPVCDVAGGVRHPKLGQTMRALCDALPAEPGDLTLVDRHWVDDRIGEPLNDNP